MKTCAASATAMLLPGCSRGNLTETPDFGPINILLITADDMNWNSVGCYGCNVPGTTPNIDQLASEGMRFNNGHIAVAICMPSRMAIASARYPHRSGAEGFQNIRPEVPSIYEQLRKANYLTGVLGKVGHSVPAKDQPLDMQYDFDDLHLGRDPQLYYKHAKAFFKQAKTEGRPFYMMANSHDPHRPWYNSRQEREHKKFKDMLDKLATPSKIFKPSEVKVPGFLADIPDVRKEIAQYYSSVRRCDDTVGMILKALEETGHKDNTLVMYLSDNGIAMPFAKTNCYLHSTKTPWIVRWPGKVKPGRVDDEHLISGIDFMPTVLDIIGLPAPPGIDGFSFLPVLLGKKQSGRDKVFTQMSEGANKIRFPMRCVQTKQYGYLFNPWSNGTRQFKNNSMGGLTWPAMVKAAQDDPQIKKRTDFFLYRTVEEFYDFHKDPDALNNLINNPDYQKQVNEFRKTLRKWMVETEDPALEAFDQKDDPQALEKFIEKQQQWSKKLNARDKQMRHELR